GRKCYALVPLPAGTRDRSWAVKAGPHFAARDGVPAAHRPLPAVWRASVRRRVGYSYPRTPLRLTPRPPPRRIPRASRNAPILLQIPCQHGTPWDPPPLIEF